MGRRIYSDLKTYLTKTGTRQVEFAAQIGVSQPYISKLCNRLVDPKLSLALLVAEAAHIPVETLAQKGE